MGWQEVTLAKDVTPSAWIAARLHPFAQDVGAVVPTGFAAYARIFHPAWKHDHQQQQSAVRWSEVAAANGTLAHPEMQFHSIARKALGEHSTSRGWDGEPHLGVLAASQGAALTAILAKYTTTPGACWFCLWDGYGYLHPGTTKWLIAVPNSMRFNRVRRWWLHQGLTRRRPRPPTGPRVRLPYRDYLLFHGSVEQGAGWTDGPNLWWPSDRTWCVASEIDFPYTYVGGEQGLIDAILAHPALEAMPAGLNHKITADADTINS